MPEDKKDAVAGGGDVTPENTVVEDNEEKVEPKVFTQADADAMAGNIKGVHDRKLAQVKKELEDLKAQINKTSETKEEDPDGASQSNVDAVQVAVKETEASYSKKLQDIEQKYETERNQRVRDRATIEIHNKYLAANGRKDGIELAVTNLLNDASYKFGFDEKNMLVVTDIDGHLITDTQYSDNAGILTVEGAVKKMIAEHPIFQAPIAGNDTGMRAETTSQTPRTATMEDIEAEARAAAGDKDAIQKLARKHGLETK